MVILFKKWKKMIRYPKIMKLNNLWHKEKNLAF